MASDEFVEGFRAARRAILKRLQGENNCQCYCMVGEMRVPHVTHIARDVMAIRCDAVVDRNVVHPDDNRRCVEPAGHKGSHYDGYIWFRDTDSGVTRDKAACVGCGETDMPLHDTIYGKVCDKHIKREGQEKIRPEFVQVSEGADGVSILLKTDRSEFCNVTEMVHLTMERAAGLLEALSMVARLRTIAAEERAMAPRRAFAAYLRDLAEKFEKTL